MRSVTHPERAVITITLLDMWTHNDEALTGPSSDLAVITTKPSPQPGQNSFKFMIGPRNHWSPSERRNTLTTVKFNSSCIQLSWGECHDTRATWKAPTSACWRFYQTMTTVRPTENSNLASLRSSPRQSMWIRRPGLQVTQNSDEFWKHCYLNIEWVISYWKNPTYKSKEMTSWSRQ